MNNIKKLGLGIVAFEGVEHLKNILWEIKDYIDVVVVCLQKKSYNNIAIDKNDVNIIRELKELGYINKIIWFETKNLHLDKGESSYRYIECDKRNFILDYLEFNEHCTHSFIIDSDEYYNHEEFENAKNIIDKENYKVNYCEYVNYYKDYRHTLFWPFTIYVPFITQSSFRFDIELGNFDKGIDITRKYVIPNDVKYNIFDFKIIHMHHLSFIRLNIEKKLNCWSSQKYFDSSLKQKVIERYNNYKDGQSAILLVRAKEVEVNKYVKEYISPKFALDEKPTKYKKHYNIN